MLKFKAIRLAVAVINLRWRGSLASKITGSGKRLAPDQKRLPNLSFPSLGRRCKRFLILKLKKYSNYLLAASTQD
jgi:hypothetical protein